MFIAVYLFPRKTWNFYRAVMKVIHCDHVKFINYFVDFGACKDLLD
jgi:hypothetical protein